jgi:mycothiol synthase
MMLQLPEGFYVRAPKLDDARIVTNLIRISQQRSGVPSEITNEEIRAIWQSQEVDLEQDTWLIFAPDDQLVAYLLIIHYEPAHPSIDLRVHPDYITVSLCRELLACVEERARQLIPQVHENARVALKITSSAQTHPTTIEAIVQAGFVSVRNSFRMEIEMDTSPPPATWPEGIVPRPFTLDMARAVYMAADEAFKDHWGHVSTPFEIFEDFFIKAPNFDPTLWFLPFAGEEIAGTALCADKGNIAFVNSMAVRRPWRRQGLGLALLYHAFGEFYRRGQRKVALYVDAQSLTGATRLYERAGMRVARQIDHYEKELRAGVELGTQDISA